MNHPSPRGKERGDFVPLLDYLPPTDEEIDANLAQVFDRLNALSPGELALLAHQADQAEAERTAQRQVEG